MTSSRILAVLPSYNERDNIVQLVDSILQVAPDLDVCIVDDSSPDQTSAVVSANLPRWNQRVHLITRKLKDGRGGAVRAGLVWGMAQGGTYQQFIEMDCDFSHDPEEIPKGLALLAKGGDLILGSRYPDGKIYGWPWRRRVFSFAANGLARMLISWRIADYTNGFRFYTREVVAFLLEQHQRNKGYIYLSEALSLALRRGFRIESFPIIFRNRERGASNTDLREVSAAALGILQIAWSHHHPKPPVTVISPR